MNKKGKSMTIPPSYVPYLEKYRIYDLFQELLSSLIVNQPEDHLEFLKNEIYEVVKLGNLIESPEDPDKEKTSKDELDLVQNDKERGKSETEKKEVTERRCRYIFGENEYREPVKLEEKDSSGTNETDTKGSENDANDKEKKELMEQVITDWKKIKRSKKWFSLRQVSSSTERDLITYKEADIKVPSEEIDLIHFSLHTEEKEEIVVEKERSQSEVGKERDSKRIKKSTKIFNIQLQKGDDTSDKKNEENTYEHVIGLSYVHMSKPGSERELEVEQDLVDHPVEVLDGIPGINISEIKRYIVNLVQETVDDIFRARSSDTPPKIDYYYKPMDDSKKKVKFPRRAVLIPRVVILGPPGSGKSLQASLLAKKRNLVHVEMDKLLLMEKYRTNNISRIIRRFSLKHNDFMTTLNISILAKRLLEPDCLKYGWVLTGFPENAAQAVALDKIETPLNRVVYLDKPIKMCKQIMLTRAYNVDTGEVCFLEPGYCKKYAAYTSNINPDDCSNFLCPDEPFTITINGNIVESEKSSHQISCEGVSRFDHKFRFQTIDVRHSPEDDIDLVKHRFKIHEAAKDELLRYYGGWCKIIEVGRLPPMRVQEAILSVVLGPSPSFEEVTINDRSPYYKEKTVTLLGSHVKDILKKRLSVFFSEATV